MLMGNGCSEDGSRWALEVGGHGWGARKQSTKREEISISGCHWSLGLVVFQCQGSDIVVEAEA